MSDGAHLGITAGRVLGTVIGGDDQPEEDERTTAEETRARIEAAPLFEGPKPWEQFAKPEGEINDEAYNAATDSIAHAFLILLEEDETLLEPWYYPEDCEHEILRGTRMSADSPFWEAMKERWPHADDWVGGASGFMVGFALNAALYASGKELIAPNPSILEIRLRALREWLRKGEGVRIELVGADQEIMREIAEALAENEQAWEDMRAYNIRLEERAREAECALAEIIAEADELLLWQPGKKGYAVAHKRFYAAICPYRSSEDTSDES